MKKITFLSAIVLFFLIISRPENASGLNARVDKASYGPLERIKVSLINDSSEPVFFSRFFLEKKGALGNWELIPYEPIRGEGFRDKVCHPLTEIKPREMVTFEWLPHVFTRNDDTAFLPADGIHRIRIPYGLQQHAMDLTLSASTHEFSFVIDNVRGALNVEPGGNAYTESMDIQALDTDRNGAFDKVTAEGSITVKQKGLYEFEACLFDNNSQLRRVNKSVVLKQGKNAFYVDFDAHGLQREVFPTLNGWDESIFNVSKVIIMVREPDGHEFIRQWHDEKKFRPAQFEGAVALLLKEGIKDEITPDGNLKITGRLRVFQPVKDTLFCSLFDPADTDRSDPKGSDNIKIDFSQGEHEFTIVFNGTVLSMNRERGPFRVVFQINEDYLDTGYITRSNTASLVKEVVLGNYGSEILDPDHDGYFDTLQVSFDVAFPEDGKYFIYLPLMDSRRKEITRGWLVGSTTGSNSAVDFKKGRYRLTIGYDWREIATHGQDGPYSIFDYINDIDNRISDKVNYITPVYKLSDYPALRIINSVEFPSDCELKTMEIINDYPEDTDNDGKYDYLVSTVEVEMVTGGTFESNLGSLDQSGQQISPGVNAQGNYLLKPGKQTIQLRFPGHCIYASRLNGPYEVMFKLEKSAGSFKSAFCDTKQDGNIWFEYCSDGKASRHSWMLRNYKTKAYPFTEFSPGR